MEQLVRLKQKDSPEQFGDRKLRNPVFYWEAGSCGLCNKEYERSRLEMTL